MENKGSKNGRTRGAGARAPAGSASRAAGKPATPESPAAKKPATPRNTAASSTTARTAITGQDRADLVRQAAYFRAERRGFTPGNEVEDWLAAEAEVDEKLRPASKATTSKSVKRKPGSG